MVIRKEIEKAWQRATKARAYRTGRISPRKGWGRCEQKGLRVWENSGFGQNLSGMQKLGRKVSSQRAGNAWPRNLAFTLRVIKHHWTIWNQIVRVQRSFCLLAGCDEQKTGAWFLPIPRAKSIECFWGQVLSLPSMIFKSPQEISTGSICPKVTSLGSKEVQGKFKPQRALPLVRKRKDLIGSKQTCLGTCMSI